MVEKEVKLVKSRYFVSMKNLDSALTRVQNEEHRSWKINSTQTIYNPLENPTPFDGVKSLLEFLGFTTYESENGSIWIRDFKDRSMSNFEARTIVKVLLLLSQDENGSFIQIKLDNYDYSIADGYRLDQEEDEASQKYSDFENLKVGRSPWSPLN